jgi:hypothetical protein
MKSLLLLLALVFHADAGTSKTRTASPEPLMHTETSFNLIVKAPYAETAPLFGPEGERAWAGKHWDPQFIHPRPARDSEGGVFTIEHGLLHATWVITAFDVEGRHFQYVYFLPALLVTTIDVRFKALDDASTQVTVVYARTALTPEGNAQVATMTEGDRSAGKEWQQSIDTYLATRKAGRTSY